MSADTTVSIGIETSLMHSPTRKKEFSPNEPLKGFARKILISHDSKTAIAFAGSVDLIRDFLEYAEFTIDDFSSARPLRRLAARASDYRSRDLNVLAITCDADSPMIWKVKPDKSPEKEIEDFGYYASIGSGIRDFDKFIAEVDGGPPRGQSPENVVRLALEFRVRRLVDEIYLRDIVDPSWGGLQENVYFDFDKNVWKREPSCAIFLHQYNLDEVDARPQLIDRMFLYEPGIQVGWFHSIRSASDYAHNITFPILPIFPELDHEQDPPDWGTWLPAFILHICVAGRAEGTAFLIAGIGISYGPADETRNVTRGVGRTGIRFNPCGRSYETFLDEQKSFWSAHI